MKFVNTFKQVLLITLCMNMFVSVFNIKASKATTEQITQCFKPGKDWNFSHFFTDNNLSSANGSSIEFSVKGKDFYVGIFEKNQNGPFFYTVVYGGWTNSQSVVFKNDRNNQLCTYPGVKVKNENGKTNYKIVYNKSAKTFSGFDSGVKTFECKVDSVNAKYWGFSSWLGDVEICPPSGINNTNGGNGGANGGNGGANGGNGGATNGKCSPKGIPGAKIVEIGRAHV